MLRTWLKNLRQSLFLPILLGVVAILFTIAILVGWSIIFTRHYMLITKSQPTPEPDLWYWVILWLGCLFLIAVISTLVLFLISNIRQKLYMRQQTSFIDSVTHELKSPLASLRLSLETMERHELTETQQEKFFDMMKADVERLSTFIEHILEAGRLEQDERDLLYEETNLRLLANKSLQQIRRRHKLSEEELLLEDHLHEQSILAYTAPVALDTIVLNLLDNAAKYSPRPAHITLALQRQQQTLRIEVRDQGLGIPSGLRKKIFRRFYRIQHENRMGVRGTGLGLYVVESLVKRLGGRIQVHSAGEEQGTTFTVDIPLHSENKVLVQPQQAAQEA